MDQTSNLNKEVLHAARSGDHEAYRIVMEFYAPLVNSYLYSKIKQSDIEDVLQEVFLSAYRDLPKLKKNEVLGPWLMRITRRRVADYYRNPQRRVEQITISTHDERADSVQNAPNLTGNPLQYTELNQLSEDVQVAMGRLNDKYRIVLYLRLFEEQSSVEIAGILGQKESTIRVRLKRGLEKLRKELSKQGIKDSQGY